LSQVILLAAYATGIAMVRFVAPWSLAAHGMAVGLLLLFWLFLRHSRWGWLLFLSLLLVARLPECIYRPVAASSC
jgi:hypothetical protein